MFNVSKRYDIRREGVSIRIPIGAVYYIITKVFSYKKIKINKRTCHRLVVSKLTNNWFLGDKIKNYTLNHDSD